MGLGCITPLMLGCGEAFDPIRYCVLSDTKRSLPQHVVDVKDYFQYVVERLRKVYKMLQNGMLYTICSVRYTVYPESFCVHMVVS